MSTNAERESILWSADKDLTACTLPPCPQFRTASNDQGTPEPIADRSRPIPVETRGHPLGAFLRFGQLSGLSFAINLGATVLLHEWLALPTTLAFAMAIVVVLMINFALMRYYVFPAEDVRRPSIIKQGVGFCASSVVFRSLEYVGFYLVHVVVGVYYVLAIAMVSGLSFVAKFVFYQRWLFGGQFPVVKN